MQVNFLTRYCQISASLPLTMLELVHSPRLETGQPLLTYGWF